MYFFFLFSLFATVSNEQKCIYKVSVPNEDVLHIRRMLNFRKNFYETEIDICCNAFEMESLMERK